MNRSLLLIVCDFLLLSFLALVDFEDAAQEEEAPPPQTAQEVIETREDDIIAMLRMDLESQQATNEALSEANTELSEELAEKQVELNERAKELADTTSRLQETETRLDEAQVRTEDLLAEQKALEERKRALEEEKEAVEQERQSLQSRVMEAQNRLDQTQEERLALSRELAQLQGQSAASAERLRFLQDQLAEKEQVLARAEEEMDSLEGEKTKVERERNQLETALQVAQTEKSALNENLRVARSEMELVRREKQEIQQQARQLAEGVSSLAESSQEIQKEVAQLQTQTLNAIFERYQQNNVRVRFSTVERSFGSRERTYDVRSVLVHDGEGYYVIFHRRGTPLESERKVNFVEDLTATIELAGQWFRVSRLKTLKNDSRLLAIEVRPELIEDLKLEPYHTSSEPKKYASAVLVNTGEHYYGESSFRIFTENDRYLEMDRELFSELFGKFSPEAGDIVFSRHGEIMGFMANGTYAVLTEVVVPGSTVELGGNFSQDQAETLIAALESSVRGLARELR
jgi:predicted  nucleic acid-binding Zn-ribbon protein